MVEAIQIQWFPEVSFFSDVIAEKTKAAFGNSEPIEKARLSSAIVLRPRRHDDHAE